LEEALFSFRELLAVSPHSCGCPLLFADQIVLKNGGPSAGTIEKSDDKSMMIKTEYASEVTVDWQAVQDFKSDQPLHVGSQEWRKRGRSGHGQLRQG